MVLTTEQRQLLEGDPERAQRNLPLLGWGSVGDSCPDHFVERIIEIRQAIVEKRAVPAPSRSYVAGAEQRSLESRAFGFAKRIFRSEDSELRDRLAKQARRISDDCVRARANEILLEEARAGFALGVEAASEDGGQVSEGGTPTFRCKATSTSSTAEEHRYSARVHRVHRDRATNANAYAWDDEAADDHDDAADGDEEAAIRCVARCGKK